MAGLLKRAARHAVAAATVATGLRPIVGAGDAVVLRYHRVAGSADRPVPLAVTPGEFEAQVRFLRAHCQVVTADAIAAAVAEERPLPPRAVAITFDDGYEDNFSQALPALARHGVEATFFVTAGWIGSDRVLWWDRLHEYVRQSAEEGATPTDYEDLPQTVAAPLAVADVRSPAGRARLERDLVAALRGLDLSPEELDAMLERVAAALGVGEPCRDGYLPMDWDQVRGLREAGMAIGSHTVAHARLTAVPPDRAYEELARSKEAIERELDEPIGLLAYPAGDHNADVVDLAAEAGYEAAFTTISGPVRGGDSPFTLRRIGVWGGGYAGAVGRFSPSVFGLQIGRLARRG